MLEFLEGYFQFLAIGRSGEDAVKPYPLVEDLVVPALRVRMPRALRTEADSDRERDWDSEETCESWQQAGGEVR